MLRGRTITYYAEDDLESAKPLGVIELGEVTYVMHVNVPFIHVYVFVN